MKSIVNLSAIFIILNFFANCSNALDVIYPQHKEHKTSSSVTYIMGSVKPSSTLKINGENVKVWRKGAFCKTVQLSPGHNSFKIVEINGDNTESVEYNVNRIVFSNKPKTKSDIKNTPKIEYFENLQYATVTAEGSPVRESYSTDSERITHLPENTIIFIEGKYKDWYKILTGDNSQFWIHSKNSKVLYPINNYPISSIHNIEFSRNKIFSELRLTLDYPVMFKTKEDNSNIYLTLFGVKNNPILQKLISKQKIFLGLKTIDTENNNLTLLIPADKPLWGYQVDYDRNVLVFKKKNTPSFNVKKPLKNITIAIDPGHGGKELGTVGPLRTPEKDVNLSISKKLKNLLEQEGAKVIMTREDDSFVDLYQRPDIANENNALICLSIHANSLVDKDPYEKHGVSTFYYHPQAKELANQIKLQMINELKLKDDGLRKASFVLTRPSMPLSVLIEVAYMPNPQEFLMLTDENFQQNAAKSITEGLKNYIKSTMIE